MERVTRNLEGVPDRVNGQRAWGDVTGMEHKIKKMGFKWSHLQHSKVSKEVPM